MMDDGEGKTLNIVLRGLLIGFFCFMCGLAIWGH